MWFYAFATDYDGTLATGGRVTQPTIQALQKIKDSGRKIVLVSGRPLDVLIKIFPELAIFDRVVAENGALLLDPANHEEKLLGPKVPAELVEEIKRRNLPEFHVGQGVINAYEPYQTQLLEIIKDLGLGWDLIFNKGNIMVLPAGINKASGLRAALTELGLSPHNTAAIGDAENDLDFMRICEVSAAVADALPSVKKRADLVMKSPNGAGVAEFAEMLVGDELASLMPHLERHQLVLGERPSGEKVAIPPSGINVVLFGHSGSGKSTLTKAFLETLYEQQYQFLVVDPEGDYAEFEIGIPLGNEHQSPTVDSVVNVLEKTDKDYTANLISLPYEDRPTYLIHLLGPLKELREQTGRPHWVIIDEAHQLFPSENDQTSGILPEAEQGFMMVTTTPTQILKSVLEKADLFLFAGSVPIESLAVIPHKPDVNHDQLVQAETHRLITAWWNRPGAELIQFRAEKPKFESVRHRRKYAKGELPAEFSFYFRGPEKKLNLRAANLIRFVELADGVDDETWQYHLKNGDITKWFTDIIKDDELANTSQDAAKDSLSPKESRSVIRKKIEERYTNSE